MRIRPLLLTFACLLTAPAFAANGVISVKSAHDVATTADRLEQALLAKGMKVFTRIDHAVGAASVGETLRPTQLVLFGNPKVGTPLMKCAPGVAIDLPQKALIWEDAAGAVWLSYNDPAYLVERHDLGECGGVPGKVAGALANFARAATQP